MNKKMTEKIIEKIGINFSDSELKEVELYINNFTTAYDQYLDSIDINLDMVPSANFGNNNIIQSRDLFNDNLQDEKSIAGKYLGENSSNFKDEFFVLKK